jgi:molybdopterin molybdotransferase
LSESLLGVDEALTRILKNIEPLPAEQIPFDGSSGRVLAQDVFSALDLPPHASSAMDGYAVAAADLATALPNQPVRLEVIGEVAAGQVSTQDLQPGQAIAISTGAPLPAGADAVVPIEWVEQGGGREAQADTRHIRITRGLKSGDYVRPAGNALKSGELVLRKNRRLRPADIGMLASVNQVSVLVHRRPRVAVFSSGDELVEPGQRLTPGKIHDSNRYALTAAVQDMGAEALRLPLAHDSRTDVRSTLEEAVAWGPDLILSSAGVSVGKHDHVRPVVQEAGDLDFWRVNIRPGKPIAFGHYRGIPFMGLPGNPVSMLVTFELFAKPLLAALMGLQGPVHIRVAVRLRDAVQSDGRESYLRSVVFQSSDHLEAVLTGSQDSGILSSMVKANALLRIPAGVEHLPTGAQVEALLLGTPAVEK